MSMTEPIRIQAAKKRHQCSWCGHFVLPGEPYDRYRWFDCGDAATVKMHPECLEAMFQAVREEGGETTFSPGDNPRGCCCGHDKDCPKCAKAPAPSLK